MTIRDLIQQFDRDTNKPTKAEIKRITAAYDNLKLGGYQPLESERRDVLAVLAVQDAYMQLTKRSWWQKFWSRIGRKYANNR